MYKITDQDLQEGIPFAKLYQLRWKSTLYKKARRRLAVLYLRYLDGEYTSEEVKLAIYAEIGKLKKAYPEEFPIPGWWDKSSANVLVLERTTPKTLKIVQTEVCYVCRVKLDSGYTAKLIEGVWWKIHGRCQNKPIKPPNLGNNLVYKEILNLENIVG